MPDNNKKHKTLPKDQFLKLVRAGIRKVESDNRYGLLNTTKQKDGTPTYALGAYQFVPSHHWNDIVIDKFSYFCQSNFFCFYWVNFIFLPKIW